MYHNLNCDTNNDGKCELNCDTNKDGKCDLNCDTNKDGKCDLNCDTNKDGKCDLNCDTNKDGKCDLNCDTNNDGKCDTNCDTNGDGKCDLNCDTNKDGKCDLNCDTDGDGVCDKNCDTNGDGKCDTNCDNKEDNVDINEGNEYVLTLTGSDYDVSKIVPGWTGTKKFKLSNTTNTAQTISMKWINVQNTFTTTNNLYYSVNRGKTNVIKNARTPYKETDIMTNIVIPAKTTYEWTFNFKFKDTGKNQDVDMGKLFDAKIKIIVKQK